MFLLSYKIDYKDLDITIENLAIQDIYNVFYDAPLEITTDDYGYGYVEKENEEIIIQVAFEGEKSDLNVFESTVNSILNLQPLNIEENTTDYTVYDFPTVYIDDNWALVSPYEEIEYPNKINFISQGAFGTGLHETTQDILRVILNKLDIKDKTVLDIGTGSGILSLASAIVGAKKVTAVDIRDVADEVIMNANLNNLTNIEAVVGDILEDESLVQDKYDWIYINIGGEETKMFMPFIKSHLKDNGKLLVSGLVEWSFDEVSDVVTSYEFKLVDKYQTNEWCTAVYN
ncbi:MAG: 50S ribosomal protein L11 methyltransferase [Clostridium sp.]